MLIVINLTALLLTKLIYVATCALLSRAVESPSRPCRGFKSPDFSSEGKEVPSREEGTAMPHVPYTRIDCTVVVGGPLLLLFARRHPTKEFLSLRCSLLKESASESCCLPAVIDAAIT